MANRREAIGCIAILFPALLLGLMVYGMFHFGNPFSAVKWQAQIRDSDPQKRKEAIESILQRSLKGDKASGWQSIQTKGCNDPDAGVRTAAVNALAELTEKKPHWIVTRGLIGWRADFLDRRVFGRLGTSDPSPEVRSAVAAFWQRADVWWDKGLDGLQEMLATEKEAVVQEVAREALAKRLEKDCRSGRIKADEARRIQNEKGLRDVNLQ